jgi:hypothetical protein
VRPQDDLGQHRAAVRGPVAETLKQEDNVKRLWLVVGLAILGGMVADTFADVQNIRLSGDIRIRGYYLANASVLDTIVGNNNRTADSFITQRTRVTVEADLEDHVLVVVTLRAEGMWGSFNESLESTAGAGLLVGPFRINRGFDVGINEAYVQLSEIFYTPATLKLGRQKLHFGRGLILSSVDEEWNFDAARLVLDFYPLVIDLVYAKAFEGTLFSSGGIGLGTLTGGTTHDADMYFANARFEMTDSFVKAIEVYAGFVDNDVKLAAGIPLTTIPWAPPTAAGASPGVIGVRADLNLSEALSMWMEGAYEFGADGFIGNKSISAWMANVGGQFALKDVQWTPMFNVNYIYASGGGSVGENYFRPWFDYTEGYNGYLFHPLLSNLHIFNVGASVKPAENTTVSVQGYYYLKVDKDGFAVSNPNTDFGITGAIGGLGGVGTGTGSREIGWELDTILGYDYSKDVRCQLVYAAFIPENDIQKFSSFNAVAHEVRAELNVRF